MTAEEGTARRALMFTPMETRRDVLVDAAIAADRLGYEAVIIPEGWGYDVGVVLADLAARTQRIQLVAGVVSPWGRSPAQMAMMAATLDEVSGGRFVLGLGASTPALAERFHGVAFEAPVMRLERYVREVRALLAGERAAPLAGRGLRLGVATPRDIPIWIAGLGPRARAVAFDHADGWFPAMTPRAHLANVVGDRVGNGDRRPVLPLVAAGPVVAICDESFDGAGAARQIIGWYLTGMGVGYGDNVAAAGFGEEVAALRAANPRPQLGAVVWPDGAGPLLAELAATGSADDVRRSLAAWERAVDIVTIGIAAATPDALLAAIEVAAP